MSDKRTTVLPLTSEELARLNALTSGGTTNFGAGYRAISEMLATRQNVDADTMFFFQGAAPVNAK
jgi:hypothetical protein